MKIHNVDTQGFKLSFSNLDTLHYWGRVSVNALESYTGLQFHADECKISDVNHAILNNHNYRYVAVSQQIKDFNIILSNSMMSYLTLQVEPQDEGFDEFTLSVATVNFNTLFANIEATLSFKVVPIDINLLHNATHMIEFNFREGLHTMSVVLCSFEQQLLSVLSTFNHSHSRNLDVMLEVAFDARVEIAAIVKTVKEIIEIVPGQILELGKSIHEPLNVIVDKNIIAQGEIVQVNGNYGLEITKVCQSVR